MNMPAKKQTAYRLRTVEAWRRRKAEWHRQGLCQVCGDELAPTSKWCCEVHLEQNRLVVRRRRAELKANGLCVVCRKPRDGKSKAWCVQCFQHQSDAVRRYRAGMTEERRAEFEAVRAERLRERAEELRSLGLCARCQKPSTRFVYCIECRRRYNAYERDRAAKRKAAA